MINIYQCDPLNFDLCYILNARRELSALTMSIPIHKLINPDPPSATITNLPVELLSSIVSYLPNRDIKNLRQTCKFLHRIAHLRLSRIFLSPNPRNLEVFRAIADHETFRKQIVEIIYDDARLAQPPRLPQPGTYEYDSNDAYEEEESLETHGAPSWFVKACEENAFLLNSRRNIYSEIETPVHAARAKQLEAQLPFKESWDHYQDLLLQQDDILRVGSDIEAFRYGLKRFPALKRVTVTPAAHGYLYTPLYETPMIRSLPYGFNCPTPRGWPCVGDGEIMPEAEEWDDEAYKNNWRGFREIIRELARGEHNVTELLIDAHLLQTGLNCRIFDEPCDEYNDFINIIRRPGFRRLDLDLLVGAQEHFGWPSFRHGYLRRALTEAGGLESITLRTNVVHDPDARATVRGSAGSIEHHIPLNTIFPVEKWPRLQHFGLKNFLVTQEDVLSFLASLPPTLRTVELSFLGFLDTGGSYKTLLEGMRDTLGWQDRHEDLRPRVTICIEAINDQYSGRFIVIGKEVDDFLYCGAENPFGRGRMGLNQIAEGIGMVRDLFDPAFDRPWVEWEEYQRLGIYIIHPWSMKKNAVQATE